MSRRLKMIDFCFLFMVFSDASVEHYFLKMSQVYRSTKRQTDWRKTRQKNKPPSSGAWPRDWWMKSLVWKYVCAHTFGNFEDSRPVIVASFIWIVAFIAPIADHCWPQCPSPADEVSPLLYQRHHQRYQHRYHQYIGWMYGTAPIAYGIDWC